MKIKKKIITSLILLIYLIVLISSVLANSPGEYNQTTETRVNVTDAPPYIVSVTLPSSVDLNPGTTKEVNCTALVTDWNGWQTIETVNATFWDNTNTTQDAADLNVSHYTDTNCIDSGVDQGPYNRTFICSFDIQYYAFNSTDWICNVTAFDNSTRNFNDSESNTTTINPLYALNVTPVIDFGDAAVGDLVTNRTGNVTNFGNQPINISVQGYGDSLGDGLAMTCDLSGSIPIGDLSFDTIGGGSKTAMTGAIQNVTGLTVPRINQATIFPGTWYTTYWDLYINPVNDPFGLCNGTVVFTAWNS